MKTRSTIAGGTAPRWLIVTACLLLAATVSLSAGQTKKTAHGRKDRPQTHTLKHGKPTAKKKASYVRVTGSNISYRVTDGSAAPDASLNLTVVDLSKPENRGYSSVMDVLRRNPSVYPAYRGY